MGKKAICRAGYARGVRHVSQSAKDQVYRRYGVASHGPGEYEIDHLIPLDLGGSNSMRNLWPEAAQPTPGLHQKDKLENQLHARVCSGRMTLSAAQRAIRTDWIKAYRRYG